ncbi:MAG TPA: NADH:ubiquinone reductase (Na(+)-transporting) subunit D [Phycisphaerae bacterium]|nr:NADH:ubiquinone reductase (Na(+)-transporting) subunit D [Phycisphaerae bacterium]HQL73201.1 NADH:ubiquinone reductase (Na(+)-transporting) subunit D [Phycisphaerae bacterium]
MAANPIACASCGSGLCGGKGRETFYQGTWANNPISIQVLGICSALAVTTTLANSLIMGLALIFVTGMSNLIISLLRATIPRKVRMIAEVAVIATFVILFDQLLKAFYFSMSERLGPYVGLIITNCIVMGRAEAFALTNPPLLSVVDGLANGIGYAFVLAIIGTFRELVGDGKILGFTVLSEGWYVKNQLMILAPGAFIALGFLIAAFNYINARGQKAEAKS